MNDTTYQKDQQPTTAKTNNKYRHPNDFSFADSRKSNNRNIYAHQNSIMQSSKLNYDKSDKQSRMQR